MRRVSWAPAALKDVAAIEAHWLDDRPDYVATLLQAVADAVPRLAAQPGLGAPVQQSGRRKYRLGRTPYLIIYRDSPSELRILRVYHRQQDWRPRA